MQLPDHFYWQGDHIQIDLPGGSALFTTRRGGVSQPPYDTLNLGPLTEDDGRSLYDNYQLLQELIGGRELLVGRQVHGTEVSRVGGAGAARFRACADAWQIGDRTREQQLPEVDGHATTDSTLAAVVTIADCLPITLIAEGGMAAVHTGWRGLADGVIASGVRALRELGVESPIAAAIGPGIGACCFEVDDDVREEFTRFGETILHDGHLDLVTAARIGLEAEGVADVHDVGICTACSDPELFFSFRRDDGVTGRQAGVAWRT